MSFKIMTYGNEDYEDLILLVLESTIGFDNRQTGCVIGSDQTREYKKYPIGTYSEYWDANKEVKEDIILKSSKNLFTNGKSFVIKQTEKSCIEYGDKLYFTIVGENWIESIGHRAVLEMKNGMIWIDGKGNKRGWFNRVDEVKIPYK